jgi:hypothetical protein
MNSFVNCKTIYDDMQISLYIINRVYERTNTNNFKIITTTKVCIRFLKRREAKKKRVRYNSFDLLKRVDYLYEYRFWRNKVFYVFHQYMKAIDKNKYNSIVNFFDPESNASPL